MATGVNKMVQYLRLDKSNHAKWNITEDCNALINEMLRLRWKTWANRKMAYENNKHEQIHKKDDHACDSARYFFTLLPDLTPVPEETQVGVNEMLKQLVGPTVSGVPVGGGIDRELARRHRAGGYDANGAPSGPGTNWNITQSNDISGLEYD